MIVKVITITRVTLWIRTIATTIRSTGIDRRTISWWISISRQACCHYPPNMFSSCLICQIDLTSILESTVDSRTLITARPDRAVPRGTFNSTFHPEFRPYGPHYRETSWLDWLRGRSTNASDTFDSKSRATKPGVRFVKREKHVWKRLSAARRKGVAVMDTFATGCRAGDSSCSGLREVAE